MLAKRCLLLVLCFLTINVYGYNEAAPCSAVSAVVMERTTGAVLYEKNMTRPLGMASTTKIMTAICAIEHGDLESVVTVSPKASRVEGSSMYLEAGEKIKLSELVKGLMLVSGNDAATAISEGVSGSEEAFVLLMNMKANEIGVKKTLFQNPHGLYDEKHFTTAYDLGKITAYAMKNEKFREIVSKKSMTVFSEDGRKHTLTNHNKLLSMYDGCVGVKTGFTKKTGRCLVTSAERDGLSLVCVTLNDGDDWRDHQSLFDKAFLEYESVKIFKKGEKVTTAKVKGGNIKRVPLVAEDAVCVPVKKGEKVKISIRCDDNIVFSAPFKKEETGAEAEILIGGEPIGKITLCATEDAELKAPNKKGIFKKWFKK